MARAGDQNGFSQPDRGMAAGLTCAQAADPDGRLIGINGSLALVADQGVYEVAADQLVPQMGQGRGAVKHIQRQWLTAEVGKHTSLSRKRFEVAEKIHDLFAARLFDFGVGEGWRADAVRS